MSEKPPRFPYVATALCVGCVSMAAWTWMQYSHGRKVAPLDFGTRVPGFSCSLGGPPPGAPPPPGVQDKVDDSGLLHKYIRVSGEVDHSWTYVADSTGQPPPGACTILTDGVGFVMVDLPGRRQPPGKGEWLTFAGRVRLRPEVAANPAEGRIKGWLPLLVDTRASRFRGASIAGLVVGAMGLFVFSVALRHWMRERRV